MTAPVANNPQGVAGATGTPITLSYAVSAGADEILVDFVGTTNGSSTARTVTGVTFNGDALTNVAGATGTASSGTTRVHGSTWYRLAPAVTTANIVHTLSGAPQEANLVACYLTGAAQQAPAASAAATDASSPVRTTLTTVANDALHLGGFSSQSDGVTYTAEAGTTELVRKIGTIANGVVFGDRTQATPVSSTLGWTVSGLTTSEACSCSWAPTAVAVSAVLARRRSSLICR